MNYPIKKTIWTMACLSLSNLPLLANVRSISEFSTTEADSQGWRVVDDGVMGGLSKGKLEISKDGILNFNGKLSLKNNGGFSSLRTGNLNLDLSDAEGIVARVKGDGRTYQVRFSTDARFRGMEISFKADFETKKDQWIEIKVPFETFSGSFRGRNMKDQFAPSKIRRIGLLLGDKKAGPFELEVDWLRTYGDKAQSNDILTAALADGRFTTLAAALTEAKLIENLQGDGPFTVFAPTDKAFSKLPKDTVTTLLKPENREKLQAILTYHVLAGSIDLAGALTAKKAKTVQGAELKIGFNGGKVLVNGAAIIDADIWCSNGIIHVIDSVILPPEPVNDIASVAKRAGNFKTLLAAVDAAGLTDILTGDQPVTILAPTDEAFAALPKGTVASLLKAENRDQLIAILSLHVISGEISAGDALNLKNARSASGGALEFGIVDGSFKVDGATIVITDIACANGVIHVIDTVLLPKTKTTPTPERSALQQIKEAISKGVPIFNDGEPGKCADIYRDCILAIYSDAKVTPSLEKTLNELIQRSEKMQDDTQRAWILRKGLDQLYSALLNN